MAEVNWPLYDTAPFGNVAATTHTLFQVRENGDATHITGFTNMRGNGSLPSNESFMVERLMVYPDVELAEADLVTWFGANWLRLRVEDKEMITIPLRMCVGDAAFGGHYTQASTAANSAIGPMGKGYELSNPVMIPQGGNLLVEVFQATALATTGQNIKIVLDGILNRP